jgi:hypothetical protein
MLSEKACDQLLWMLADMPPNSKVFELGLRTVRFCVVGFHVLDPLPFFRAGIAVCISERQPHRRAVGNFLCHNIAVAVWGLFNWARLWWAMRWEFISTALNGPGRGKRTTTWWRRTPA